MRREREQSKKETYLHIDKLTLEKAFLNDM